jgi:hypothetical protein
MPADHELSEKLATALHDRFAANKEKVKIIPNGQVRPYQNKVASKAWSPAELGKKLKADYVIAMEINDLSLNEKGSGGQLLRGSALIDIHAYDVSKEKGEQTIYEETYTTIFPKESPKDAIGSIDLFRTQFLTRVARDLSRRFAAYPNDERMYEMSTD